MIFSSGDFNGHVENYAESVHGGMKSGKKMWKEEDCWSSVMKKSCAWQTCGLKSKRKK